MKHFALVAAASAAVTASSSVALSAASDCSVSNNNNNKGLISSGSIRGVKKNEKIFPRFDGLRFIETLVTAHR